MFSGKLHRSVLLLIMAVFLPVASACACSTCFGDPDAPESRAVVWAVAAMLGTTTSVLTGIAAFGLYLWRRSALAERTESETVDE